jgi:5-methylcytosine-specific restriction endonuclease McrA
VFVRDDGRCTYIEKNGLACDSCHGIQIDHIIPVALGGTNDLDNLRLLCREHNLLEANRLLGEQVMGRYGAGRSVRLGTP